MWSWYIFYQEIFSVVFLCLNGGDIVFVRFLVGVCEIVQLGYLIIFVWVFVWSYVCVFVCVVICLCVCLRGHLFACLNICLTHLIIEVVSEGSMFQDAPASLKSWGFGVDTIQNFLTVSWFKLKYWQHFMIVRYMSLSLTPILHFRTIFLIFGNAENVSLIALKGNI